MLRLPDRVKHGLYEALMSWLLALSLALPALRLMDLWMERGRSLWLMLLFASVLSLTARLKRLPRLILSGALLALLVWWSLTSGLVTALGGLMGALVTMQPSSHLIQLYSDLLLMLLALTLVLFARLLIMGEPAFSVPMLLSSALMLWFSGARQQLTDFLPMVFAMPLLFVYAGYSQDALKPAVTPRKGLLRALPVALVIGLVALMLTPGQRMTDPNLEHQADRLRQYINDHFFFTSSRENFSLASEGYQPMGGSGLGGRPQINPGRVMQVDTDHKVYLRGTMLDLYNGRQWFDSLSNERYGYSAARFQPLRDRLLNAALPEKSLRGQSRQVDISILSDLTSTLFMPQRLRSLSLADGMVPYLNASSELFITRNLQPGDHYSAVHESYVAGTREADQLAERLYGQQDEAFALQPEQYLQLPRHLTPGGMVERLARDIVGQERDPYRMAMKIRTYLREHYQYTLDVVPAPEDMDFAQHFLFETGEGYCTYFATAMTVLCRSLSLPARYIEGFVALPNPDGSPAVITGQQAHAWTEVYVPNMGWVTFDATATTGELPPSPEGDGDGAAGNEPEASPPPETGEQQGEDTQEVEQPADGPTPTPPPAQMDEPTPTPAPEHSQQPDRRPPPSFAWLWWLLLIALIGLYLWRVIAASPERRAEKAADDGQRLLIFYQAYLSAQALHGQPLMHSETLIAYARRIAQKDEGLLRLSEAVSATLYGRQKQTAPEWVLSARLYYRSAYQHLRPHLRLWLTLRRGMEDILQQVKSLLSRVKALLIPSRPRR